MTEVAHPASDYARAFLAGLPTGRVWPRDADSTQAAAAGRIALSWARNDSRAFALLTDAFPITAVELLPEWEATLGLPDPCAGEAPTLQQRRAQVAARIIGLGGQSVDYYTAFAAALGYSITITEYAPARFGIARFGDPFLGAEWATVWQINAPLQTVTIATFGVSLFGEPYQAWGNAVLECELAAIKPAHTTLLFHYA